MQVTLTGGPLDGATKEVSDYDHHMRHKIRVPYRPTLMVDTVILEYKRVRVRPFWGGQCAMPLVLWMHV